MAYLKCRYLKEFMAVLMSYSIGRISAIKGYIKELAQNGIVVETPDINYSTTEFNIVGDKIYYLASGSLFCLDKDTQENESLNKSNYLSDFTIDGIYYNLNKSK